MNLRHENLITFSEKEMLDYWKTQFIINPAQRNCSIERKDGIDIDNFLIQHIRQWYADILASADVSQLPQKDFSNLITATVSPNLVARLSIPENAIQPVMLKLSSWEEGLTSFYSPESFQASLQYDDFTRARHKCPVAIVLPKQIIMYSAEKQTDILTNAIFTVRPPMGTYTLAESLLSTIPKSLESL